MTPPRTPGTHTHQDDEGEEDHDGAAGHFALADRKCDAERLQVVAGVDALAAACAPRYTRRMSPQRGAIARVQAHGEASRDRLRARHGPLLDELAALVRARARVTLNFHPDRLLEGGDTVANDLLARGRYRSQFETGISNGSRTAFAGGDRDRWEAGLFGGAYHASDVTPADRPKYGALDLFHHLDGGSPRFGSCFFVLRRELHAACTFTWGDSHEGPEHMGTLGVLEPLLGALLDSVATRGEALGLLLDRPALVAALASPSGSGVVGRALDAYIEAQVHAELDLATAFEALVIDPSFDGTATGDRLEALAARYRIPLTRHPGFVLARGEVPSDVRGPRMVPLAHRIAVADRLDAAVVGEAAASLHRTPALWQDWDPSVAVTLQHLKQIWHVLVHRGHPRVR